ncbi:hypothetical protein DDE19_10625 [Micromonospora ureilytica]|uniref:ABC-type Na+ efflux pump permease subunit n=1 Tax=Micromonospora ureilytica TaxID=709868 RepID=A0A3N9XY49_9ACTN|nr:MULTISPECIES: hypothetical protein [Micromonospora]MBG6063745.1 ABC-type Na+ efflux pump permease subunit [Micromonospora ureilytica]MBQ1020908.1 hypothetical protein [Micromonospora sp. D93]RQX17612.1 hypothetical protein DDE19_10625 [Micromonospora ureilytica]WSG33292.1 hypothetical protein OHB55_04535 [Micromonospora ureilytica]WSR56533.1 hypothetical protein OG400_33175 [Micromonospora ureilytica]
MRGKIMFLGGLAAGFVLGARAGREKYEELVVRGRKVLDHPTVQEAAGVAQAQANKLYSEGKDKLGQTKLGEKLGTGNGSTGTQELTAADDAFAGTPATVGAKAGTSTVGTTSGSPSSTNPRTKPSGSGTNASTL